MCDFMFELPKQWRHHICEKFVVKNTFSILKLQNMAEHTRDNFTLLRKMLPTNNSIRSVFIFSVRLTRSAPYSEKN